VEQIAGYQFEQLSGRRAGRAGGRGIDEGDPRGVRLVDGADHDGARRRRRGLVLLVEVRGRAGTAAAVVPGALGGVAQ
jgi:hypothetical protein